MDVKADVERHRTTVRLKSTVRLLHGAWLAGAARFSSFRLVLPQGNDMTMVDYPQWTDVSLTTV